ncbi:hypothetical protein LTR08_001894 [Meristemomyces frigidus]|nr:hypothetical protein LTR08_001894 [Meristemomyces frigidus]
MPRAVKRAKLVQGAGDGSDDDGRRGVRLPDVHPEAASNAFTINEDFAKRFEHNKKREERQRLEEKFSKGANGKRPRSDDDSDDDGDLSTDESEDDDANLATADLDAEIMETLQAIKKKDPRVYDPTAKFFREFDVDAAGSDVVKKEKPMYLQDYHRQNLMAGHAGGEEDDAPVQTYQEEQDALKRELVGSMHATARLGASNENAEDEDDLLVAKSKPKHDALPAAKKTKPLSNQDIAAADKDPESYLSNFMAARAWLPKDASSRFEAFDSDDSEEERRADEFEDAYNMRFEDPKKANEKLLSFARDVGKYGVRRDEKTGRAKVRERQQDRKEAEKRERDEDRARLRKLKIEEAEEKIDRIREAAGLRGKGVDLALWREIIEGDFDDDEWDQEMKRRFGEKYYAEDEAGAGDSDEEMPDAGSKKKKVKKPKWNDDIDIQDLVPDFKDEDGKPDITLSSDDEADGGARLPVEPAAEDDEDDKDEDEDAETEQMSTKKRKTKKDRQQEKSDAKRAARKQRMAIEELVDATLPLSHPTLPSVSTRTTKKIAASNAPAGFRYRETSPTSFGLSARDILFADDTALNQFAGLKKMAAWRDEEKKRQDRKKFGKKQRLKQWRKETFGKVDAPEGGFEVVLGGPAANGDGGADGREAVGGEDGVRDGERKKKRKRSKKVGKGVEGAGEA